MQMEIEFKKRKTLTARAQLQLQREEDAKAFEQRRLEEKQKLRREKFMKVMVKRMGVIDTVKHAKHNLQEYEFDLVNAKLNMDVVEIEQTLPSSHTEGVGLWDETVALRIIKQKIASINETVGRPEVLFERDAIKHKPLLDKWNNKEPVKVSFVDSLLTSPNRAVSKLTQTSAKSKGKAPSATA